MRHPPWIELQRWLIMAGSILPTQAKHLTSRACRSCTLLSPQRVTRSSRTTQAGHDADMEFRWWTYQQERFPIVAIGPMTAMVGFSAVSYSTLLRDRTDWPGAMPVLVAA